jgi:hypothetical protein
MSNRSHKRVFSALCLASAIERPQRCFGQDADKHAHDQEQGEAGQFLDVAKLEAALWMRKVVVPDEATDDSREDGWPNPAEPRGHRDGQEEEAEAGLVSENRVG